MNLLPGVWSIGLTSIPFVIKGTRRTMALRLSEMLEHDAPQLGITYPKQPVTAR